MAWTRHWMLSAHASAAPWEGINALDAAVLAYTSISALRQQIKPTHRVHGIIEGRDWAANSVSLLLSLFSLTLNPALLSSHDANHIQIITLVIPDYAKLSYFVRAPTDDEASELTKRVTACFK